MNVRSAETESLAADQRKRPVSPAYPHSEELVVYFVFSPEWGRGHRVYTEEDIQAAGGIHGIEQTLKQESYWFIRLGVIVGKAGQYGIGFNDSDIAQLPTPPDSAWQIGRRNPAFAKAHLEQQTFRSAFQAVDRMLDSWKKEEDGTIDAYALKELKISSSRVVSVTSALTVLPQVHEMVRITVMKYWYDQTWSEPHLPEDDLVLAEFTLQVPLEVRRSAGEDSVKVEVMLLSSC
jgi:hypothetical protein